LPGLARVDVEDFHLLRVDGINDGNNIGSKGDVSLVEELNS
jgi:hypothetical protein